MSTVTHSTALSALSRTLACGLVALCGLAASAHADQTTTILGGGVGAVAGAVIGQSVGGRQGAVIGAAVGGATGAAVGNSMGHQQPEHQASDRGDYNRHVNYRHDERDHWDRHDAHRHHGHEEERRHGHGYGHEKHGD